MRILTTLLFTTLLVACERAPEAGAAQDQDWILAVTSGCSGPSCPSQSDEKTAKRSRSAIASTATGATSKAEADAQAAAEAAARAQLRIPDCPSGCKPAGAPTITYQVVSKDCFGGTAASRPDWWSYACATMEGSSIHWDCRNPASLPSMPHWAHCTLEVKAKGVQACAPKTCSCAEVGLPDQAECTTVLEASEGG